MKLRLALLLGFAVSAASARSIKVSGFEGSVEFNGKKIAKGEVLAPSGVLEAKGKASYVDVSLSGGGKLRLRDGRLDLNDPSAETWKVKVQGKLFVFFKKLGARGKFLVETESALAGVRGTKFLIQADPGDTYLCVCEGRVDMKSLSDAKGTSRVVKAGFDLHALKGKKTKAPGQASDMMWSMTAGEFEAMGLKVSKPTSEQ